MSDTPISDSTPHNVAELGMLCRRVERLAAVRLAYITQLETENDAANAEIERLTNKVAQLYEGAEEQNQRIKRLEEAGDRAIENSYYPDRVKVWNKAKEAKL
jgi:phospholipase/lecithinase/hemolysin